MSEDDETRPDGGSPDLSRRTLLGAIGAAAGLAGVPSTVLADPVGDAAGTERLSGVELARAQAERFGPGRLADKTGCFKPNERELYGPTDVNAETANGRLAVALNRAGSVTVFRWPRPSFYDQVKYFTRGRDADNDIVVAPNHGAFMGLSVDTGDGFATTWFRDFDVEEQRYANDRGDTDADYTDEVVTRYRHHDLGLAVTVRDLVTEDEDALVRQVRVRKRGNSPVQCANLVAFQNLGLVTEKVPQYPVQDWCFEEDNHHRARYVDRLDAIVHDTAGADPSTGHRQDVAIAVGFAGDSCGHQVGGDAHDPAAEPTADAGPARDAYDDASTGTLSGNDRYVGQATSALSRRLDFGPGAGGVADARLVVAAGTDETEAATTLGTLRDASFDEIRETKETWLANKLGDAPMPDREAIAEVEGEEVADAILATCRRALTVLATNYDRESGAVVASITTQPPYGEDWPRDGAFFNYVLGVVGRHDWVETRNRWYASIQQQAAAAASEGDVPRAADPAQVYGANTPPSNWNMCYYGDGTPGGPIPYQIDTTGFTVWTLWDHYEATGDEEYLRAVYPAIRRAADFLVECRDPSNDLQCRAFEDDRFFQPDRQTINGAVPVWLALDSAAQAAEALGRDGDADRYRARQHELGQAIDRELWDETNGAYGTKRAGFAYSETVWPGEFRPYYDPDADDIAPEPTVEDPLEHPRIQRHLTTDSRGIEATVAEPEAGELETGQYEAKALITLAKARREDGPGDVGLVRAAIRWLATRHATDDTHVMGEAWKVFEDADGDREVRSIIGQPHVWEQVLLYLTALEAYPPLDSDEFDGDSIGGVLEALREQQRPEDGRSR